MNPPVSTTPRPNIDIKRDWLAVIFSLVAVAVSLFSLYETHRTRLNEENANRAIVKVIYPQVTADFSSPLNPISRVVSVAIINDGKASAEDIDWGLAWIVDRPGRVFKQRGTLLTSGESHLPAGDKVIVNMPLQLSADELIRLRTDGWFFYLYGRMTYIDSLTSKRFTQNICYKFGGGSNLDPPQSDTLFSHFAIVNPFSTRLISDSKRTRSRQVSGNLSSRFSSALESRASRGLRRILPNS
jgi:hypothetical protein